MRNSIAMKNDAIVILFGICPAGNVVVDSIKRGLRAVKHARVYLMRLTGQRLDRLTTLRLRRRRSSDLGIAKLLERNSSRLFRPCLFWRSVMPACLATATRS